QARAALLVVRWHHRRTVAKLRQDVAPTRARHRHALPCADPPRESARCGRRWLLGPRRQLTRATEALPYPALETNRTRPGSSGTADASAIGTIFCPRVGVAAP